MPDAQGTSTIAARRLSGDVRRGRPVTIIVDNRPLDAFEGESIGAALLAAGHRVLRRAPRTGAPRGLFCGMGVCFDCLVTVDRDRRLRSCMTVVRDGMRVDTTNTGGQGPPDN